VAYESLTYGTRAQLHQQLARFIETLAADKYLDLLAYHYGLTENRDKQREYFRRAGDAAKAAYANEAALDYYARLLPLLTEPGDQAHLHLKCGAVMELVGRWDEAERIYLEALALVAEDSILMTRCRSALGRLYRLRGDYPPALNWLEQARQ